MTDIHQDIADRLYQATATGKAINPVRDLLSAGGIAGAYAVQHLNTERHLREGRRLTGRKVGLTSLAVQKQLGVDQPDFGMLFADMAIESGGEISISSLIQPKCEAEVALVLSRDLDLEHLTLPDLLSATAYALPAIEIVDSRIRNWDIQITDTIADNASSALYVLGTVPVFLNQVDLRLVGMVMDKGNQTVSQGVGAACLGHPLRAALWLANTLRDVGRPLRAGDVILTGALGPMATAQAGDVFSAHIQGLGEVRVAFS